MIPSVMKRNASHSLDVTAPTYDPETTGSVGDVDSNGLEG